MEKLKKSVIEKKLINMGIPFSQFEEAPLIEIYHIHDWDHGYDGHTGYMGTRREFYSDFFEMMEFLEDYIKDRNIQTVIISPLYMYYFNGVSDYVVDIYEEINDFLTSNKIDRRYQSGLRMNINDNFEVIRAICEGGFRDISNISMIFEEDNTVFIPHHHMNFMIYTADFGKKESMLRLLHKNPHLGIYEAE